jgi:hypothetical protein|tara:strand:- start:87 stop:440 length:354 start_codon:yes stop_codon:yes gene_type:complete
MSYKIKEKDMFLTDFKRFSILRIIARHKCPGCKRKQIGLAMLVSKMFGDVRLRLRKIESWSEIIKPARNRKITLEGIALRPRKKIALKYGLGVDQVRTIIQAGLHRKFPLGSAGKSK